MKACNELSAVLLRGFRGLGVCVLGAALLAACGGGGRNGGAALTGPTSGATSTAAATAPATGPAAATLPAGTGTLATGVRVLTDAENGALAGQAGSDVTFNGAVPFKTGEVVLGKDLAFKVVNSSNDGSKTVVRFEVPSIEELFSSVQIKGTFVATPDQAKPAQGGPGSKSALATRKDQGLDSGGSFTWPSKIVKGPLTVDSEFRGALSATVEYDFQVEKGGLQSAKLDLDTTTRLTSTLDVGAELVKIEERLGLVDIKLPVSVVDAALALVGVRVFSIRVPYYLGVAAAAKSSLGLAVVANGSGAIHARYDTVNGANVTDEFSGDTSSDFTRITTPAGAPVYESDSVSLTVYVRAEPALAFLNTAALLGVKTTLAATDAAVLQVVPDEPGYCFKGALDVGIELQGFFKTLGFAESTSAYAKPLFAGVLPPLGACLAPVIADIVSMSPSPALFGKRVTFLASVVQDPSAAFSMPAAAPTGTVRIDVGDRFCTASLAAAGASSSRGPCTLAPLVAGTSVDALITYSGDKSYRADKRRVVINVDKSGSVFTMTTSPNPSANGGLVTFSGSGLPSPSGEGDPTGEIAFRYQDGSTACVATAASGRGTCTAVVSGAGAKSLTAVYAGDANFKGSTSTPYVHQVLAPTRFWEGTYQVPAGGCSAPGYSGTGDPCAYAINTPTGRGTSGSLLFAFGPPEALNVRKNYDGGLELCTGHSIPMDANTTSFSIPMNLTGVFLPGPHTANMVFTVTSKTDTLITGTFREEFESVIYGPQPWTPGVAVATGTWTARPRATSFPKCVNPPGGEWCTVQNQSLGTGFVGVCDWQPTTSQGRAGEWLVE